MLEKLNKEDIDFIKNLSYEINTQDARCTAQPYVLVLREEVTRLVPSEYGDTLMCFWNGEEYSEWDEFIVYLKEYYEHGTEAYEDYTIYKELDEIFALDSFYDLSTNYKLCSEIDAYIQTVIVGQEIKEDNANFFLTEKAFNEHVLINGHNLIKPDSYGIHLTRNSEMRRLIEIVHKLALEAEER